MQSFIIIFTVEDYLQLEQTSEIRHEYNDDQVCLDSVGITLKRADIYEDIINV